MLPKHDLSRRSFTHHTTYKANFAGLCPWWCVNKHKTMLGYNYHALLDFARITRHGYSGCVVCQAAQDETPGPPQPPHTAHRAKLFNGAAICTHSPSSCIADGETGRAVRCVRPGACSLTPRAWGLAMGLCRHLRFGRTNAQGPRAWVGAFQASFRRRRTASHILVVHASGRTPPSPHHAKMPMPHANPPA